MFGVSLGIIDSGGAGGGGAAFESIATATGTGSSGTITFSSIPSTYKHLQVRFNARTTRTGNFEGLLIRFNSDSGNNYAWHALNGSGSSATALADSTTSSGFTGYIATDNYSSNIMGTSIIDVHDYASTSKNKTVRTFTGFDSNGAGQVAVLSSLWMNTAALNSISIISSFGSNYTTDSTFSLYGIKG
jgi:hypothetical protein